MGGQKGCGFLFSLGLFTHFIGSDYGALLYRLKPAPLKPVTTGKEGEGAEGSSKETSGNLVPCLCSSRYMGCSHTLPGLCPLSSPSGTAQTTGKEGKQQKVWSIIDKDSVID